MSSKQY